MDIIPQIKIPHSKADFASLALKHKLFLVIFLVSLVANLLPHETFALAVNHAQTEPVLVFDTANSDYRDYLDQIGKRFTDEYQQQKLHEQALKQERLVVAVKKYLSNQGSP